MNNKFLTIKSFLTFFIALLDNKFGLICPSLTLLFLLMIIDYISGMLAAKKEGMEHPNDAKYGWSSKKSIIGIYKKVGYILIVLVAISTD